MWHRNKKSTSLIRTPDAAQFIIIRIFGMIIVACMALFFAATGYFLYQEVYQTIGDVRTIILLKSHDYAEIIDFDRFEKITAEWNIKHEKRGFTNLRDPFAPIQEKASNATTSTSE